MFNRIPVFAAAFASSNRFSPRDLDSSAFIPTPVPEPNAIIRLYIGNATGLLTGLVLIVYGLFAGVVNRGISSLWNSTSGKVLVCLAGCLLAALCMYNYLIEHGVDENRLIMEDRSTSTRENLKFSMDIINEQGLSVDVAIVTNEFHEYRAFKIAEKLGINPKAVPARTHWWLFPTCFVREWYGVIYEWTGMRK